MLWYVYFNMKCHRDFITSGFCSNCNRMPLKDFDQLKNIILFTGLKDHTGCCVRSRLKGGIWNLRQLRNYVSYLSE